MYAGGRPGNDGMVHEYHGRKKYGYRCSMGRHFEVCYRHYPIRNRKVEVFYADSFEKPQMNEIINHIMRLKQKASHNKDLCRWCESGGYKGVKGKDRGIS